MATLSCSPQPLFFCPQLNQPLFTDTNVLVNINHAGAAVGRLHRTRHHLLAVSSRSPKDTELEDQQDGHRAIQSLAIAEAVSDDELWAAARLRVDSFYAPDRSVYAFEDHRRYLSAREFDALKERISPKRAGSNRAACINATLPLLEIEKRCHDLRCKCKFSRAGEDRVVVGTLDLNQTMGIADQLMGRHPEGTGAHSTRAYLCNICVAKELHRKGIAYALIQKSKKIAQRWGITDLYVHVAVDNEAAKKLYYKSGFVYENEEPAWRARFLGRPRELLLWTCLS